MELDLEAIGVSLANYSLMVFVAAFVFSAISIFGGLQISTIGGLPLIGWLGYLIGPIILFAYRRYESAGKPGYDQQVELIGLFGSLLLSPAVGVIIGIILYLIGRFG